MNGVRNLAMVPKKINSKKGSAVTSRLAGGSAPFDESRGHVDKSAGDIMSMSREVDRHLRNLPCTECKLPMHEVETLEEQSSRIYGIEG